MRNSYTGERTCPAGKRVVGGVGLQRIVPRVFSEREKISSRSAGIGIWVPVWDLLQPEAGGGLPVSRGLFVAAGGRESAGPQHAGTVSDRTVPWCAGRAVLPAGQEAGGDGRDRPPGSVCGRHKAGEPCGTVYVCLAHERRETAGEGEGTGTIADGPDQPGSSGILPGGYRSKHPICSRQRKEEREGAWSRRTGRICTVCWSGGGRTSDS